MIDRHIVEMSQAIQLLQSGGLRWRWDWRGAGLGSASRRWQLPPKQRQASTQPLHFRAAIGRRSVDLQATDACIFAEFRPWSRGPPGWSTVDPICAIRARCDDQDADENYSSHHADELEDRHGALPGL